MTPDLWMVAFLGLLLWAFFRLGRQRPTPGRPSSTRKSYVLKDEAPGLVPMPEPTDRLFTYQDERRAYKARQRLWLQYKDKTGHVTERTVEIYHPQNDEMLFTWCCLKKEPRTFYRRNIQRWRLLPEHFDFDPVVARYWKEEGTLDQQDRIPWHRWLTKHDDQSARR